MSQADRTFSDQQFLGAVSIKGSLSLPASSIGDAEIDPTEPITAVKLQHQHQQRISQSGTATSVTQTIHRVRGATASVVEVYAGSIVACVGAATVTVDVKKNGVSILSSVLTLNSSNAARVAVPATLSGSPTAVANDLFEVVVVATAGGGTLATGLHIDTVFREDAA